MKLCVSCGTSVMTDAPLCENCSRLQMTRVQTALLTKPVSDNPLRTTELPAVGTMDFGPNHLLVLDIVNYGDTLILKPAKYTVIGRALRHSGEENYIDLMRYELLAHGISRIHAALVYDHNLYLVDRWSRNGTCLNGKRLAPDTPYVLRNGSDIRIGTLAITVTFRIEQAISAESSDRGLVSPKLLGR